MYSKAASSDSAATQCTSVALSSETNPGGHVKVHSCASHAPVVPGQNRVFVADLFPRVFIHHLPPWGHVNVPQNVRRDQTETGQVCPQLRVSHVRVCSLNVRAYRLSSPGLS